VTLTPEQTAYIGTAERLDAPALAQAEVELAGRVLPRVNAAPVIDRLKLHLQHDPNPALGLVRLAAVDREAGAALVTRDGEALIANVGYAKGMQRREIEELNSLVRSAAIRGAEPGWGEAVTVARKRAAYRRVQPQIG
jgi:hypothetical protein